MSPNEIMLLLILIKLYFSDAVASIKRKKLNLQESDLIILLADLYIIFYQLKLFG